MAFAVMMPRQGQSVESCILTEWHKNVGDEVKEGDLLFTYETDKATFEEAAQESGVLLARFFEADDDVPCLLTVAVIGKQGEDISGFSPEGSSQQESAQAPVASAQEKAATPEPLYEKTAEQAAAVSPRAKNTAKRLGVDASMAAPTGPHGRVIERDVLALAQNGQKATAAAYQAGLHGENGSGIGGRISLQDAEKQKPLCLLMSRT